MSEPELSWRPPLRPVRNDAPVITQGRVGWRRGCICGFEEIRKYTRARDVFRDVGPVSYSIDMLNIFSSETTTMGPVGLSAKAVKHAEAYSRSQPTTLRVTPELEPQPVM